MGKLTPRHTPEEKARLSALLKPVESWSKTEQRLWARSHYGFRHFQASNVVPIEHFMPNPLTAYSSPHWKPAA